MQKKNVFFQEIFKDSAKAAIEDYRNLKENIDSAELPLSKPKAVYQYAEIRVKSRK